MECLNLFYEEPDPDRWFPHDRYPRRIIRRLVRGKPRPGGQMRVFLNLCAGLDRLGVPYRINDYSYIQKHPDEVACIIGKPHVLDQRQWRNPILFGTAVFSHPTDDPSLFERLPICKILVPGEWMRKMFEPVYGNRALAWPVGIDTDKWSPIPGKHKDIDILLYDKIMWERARYETELLNPIRAKIADCNLTVAEIRYGFYREEQFHKLLQQCKAMIFLCEHETQGIAYQQALASDVPILAWDQGSYWRDPAYFPHKAQFGPVSSVPYWNNACGLKFRNISGFLEQFEGFISKIDNQEYSPRSYILEHLTLEKCTQNYLDILYGIQ